MVIRRNRMWPDPLPNLWNRQVYGTSSAGIRRKVSKRKKSILRRIWRNGRKKRRKLSVTMCVRARVLRRSFPQRSWKISQSTENARNASCFQSCRCIRMDYCASTISLIYIFLLELHGVLEHFEWYYVSIERSLVQFAKNSSTFLFEVQRHVAKFKHCTDYTWYYLSNESQMTGSKFGGNIFWGVNFLAYFSGLVKIQIQKRLQKRSYSLSFSNCASLKMWMSCNSKNTGRVTLPEDTVALLMQKEVERAAEHASFANTAWVELVNNRPINLLVFFWWWFCGGGSFLSLFRLLVLPPPTRNALSPSSDSRLQLSASSPRQTVSPCRPLLSESARASLLFPTLATGLPSTS